MSDDVDDVVVAQEQTIVLSSEVIDRVVVTPETNVIFSVETDVEVVTNTEREVVYGEEERTTVIESCGQGPQGIPGPPGAATLTAMALANVGGHRAVVMSALGSVQHADNQTLAHADRLVGISISAALLGGTVQVQTLGEVVEPSWNWVVGAPVFVGSDGLLVQSAPVSPAVFSAIVGFATSPTSLYVDVREPILF